MNNSYSHSESPAQSTIHDSPITNGASSSSPGAPKSPAQAIPSTLDSQSAGAEILHAVRQRFDHYLVLPPGAAVALTLWTAHAHCFTAFRLTPRLNLQSPEPGCGKTTTLDVIASLVPRPVRTENLTAPILFRLVDQSQPTLLLDEVDTYLPQAEELRGLLNAGHKRGACAYRCVNGNKGKTNMLQSFKAFAPAVLSGLGKLPGTLHDRSIHIPLIKAEPGQIKAWFDESHADLEADLNQQLARWTAANFDAIKDRASFIFRPNSDPSTTCPAPAAINSLLAAPKSRAGDTFTASNGDQNSRRENCDLVNNIVADLGSHWEEGKGVDFVRGRHSTIHHHLATLSLHNRLGDNWRPLFAIAEIAGGDWPRLATESFRLLTSDPAAPALNNQLPTISQLLPAIREILLTSGQQRLHTRDIVTALRSSHGNHYEITQKRLSRRLSKFGISSRNIRINDQQAKGYDLADFRNFPSL